MELLGCSGVFGDLDGSGASDVIDVQCVTVSVLNLLSGSELAECLAGDSQAADLDCNGSLNVSDVLLTVQQALGQELSGDLDADGDLCPDACAPPPSADLSCAGRCGHYVSFLQCQCNATCIMFGDCCADACSLCGICD